MSNAIKITKLGRTEIPATELRNDGIIAFQLVKFEFNFYGSETSDYLDTKIMADGRQIVIDGNGFIKGGTEI